MKKLVIVCGATALAAALSPAFFFIVPFVLLALPFFAVSAFAFYAIPVAMASMKHQPRVLIIDDDMDLAWAMQAGLKRLGISADVITQFDSIDSRLSQEKADFILLDWYLEENLTGGMVMRRFADRVDSHSDLHESFANHRTRVVTYSSAHRDQIDLPMNPYFSHMGHLEKSRSCSENAEHFMNLMAGAG